MFYLYALYLQLCTLKVALSWAFSSRLCRAMRNEAGAHIQRVFGSSGRSTVYSVPLPRGKNGTTTDTSGATIGISMLLQGQSRFNEIHNCSSLSKIPGYSKIERDNYQNVGTFRDGRQLWLRMQSVKYVRFTYKHPESLCYTVGTTLHTKFTFHVLNRSIIHSFSAYTLTAICLV